MAEKQSAGTIPLRERRTLDDEWKEFARQVIPAAASTRQIAEMRRAWYAGVATMFSLMTWGLDPEREPTDLDVEYLENLHKELTEFSNAVGRGAA